MAVAAPQGDAGQRLTPRPPRAADQRAPDYPGDLVFRRLQDGAGGDRVEAVGLVLPIRQDPGLIEV
jgi:hypothetical protein